MGKQGRHVAKKEGQRGGGATGGDRNRKGGKVVNDREMETRYRKAGEWTKRNMKNWRDGSCLENNCSRERSTEAGTAESLRPKWTNEMAQGQKCSIWREQAAGEG